MKNSFANLFYHFPKFPAYFYVIFIILSYLFTQLVNFNVSEYFIFSKNIFLWILFVKIQKKSIFGLKILLSLKYFNYFNFVNIFWISTIYIRLYFRFPYFLYIFDCLSTEMTIGKTIKIVLLKIISVLIHIHIYTY